MTDERFNRLSAVKNTAAVAQESPSGRRERERPSLLLRRPVTARLRSSGLRGVERRHEFACRRHFDFVVVSQGTYAFEGRCVLERLVEINRRVAVLILAAWHDMRCYLDAMQVGAIDYLEKPRNAVDLARFVAGHMPPAHRTGGKS